jgi:hypothetical protein
MLYRMFRSVDGEYHEAIARQRADRTLMAALRVSQIEHGELLGGLAVQMTEVRSDIAELKTDVSVLKTDVSVLKTDVSELKTDVSVLKTDMAEVKLMLRQALNLPEAD